MEAIWCPSIILWMKSHPESQHRKPINPRYTRAPKGQVYKPQIELDPPIVPVGQFQHVWIHNVYGFHFVKCNDSGTGLVLTKKYWT